AVGYLDLATFLGVGLFDSFFLAFVLQAIRVVLQHLVTIGLARGPAARLHAIARHRALLERRLHKAIDVGAVALWLWVFLGHFELLAPIGALLQSVLDARPRVCALDLPLPPALRF